MNTKYNKLLIISVISSLVSILLMYLFVLLIASSPDQEGAFWIMVIFGSFLTFGLPLIVTGIFALIVSNIVFKKEEEKSKLIFNCIVLSIFITLMVMFLLYKIPTLYKNSIEKERYGCETKDDCVAFFEFFNDRYGYQGYCSNKKYAQEEQLKLASESYYKPSEINFSNNVRCICKINNFNPYNKCEHISHISLID